MTRLISVHFPKASGTSMRSALARAFSPEDLLLDYADDPADPDCLKWTAPALYESKKPGSLNASCVHGHFHPDKYDRVAGLRIVMLRHPVDTMLSIYHYWLRLAENDSAGHRLFQWFKAERPSLDGLMEVPALRYLMSRTYFGGYDMSNFSAIGDYANRGAYSAWIEEATGIRIDPDIVENVTPHTDERRRSESNASLRARMTDVLSDDVAFYARWAGTHHGKRGRQSPGSTTPG